MEFKNTPNKKYDTTCGSEVWRSRNVAVCITVVRTNPKDDTKIQVLGAKRGSAVTHAGKFCFPCGYLDWDETVPQAAQRELYEETNIVSEIKDLEFTQIDSDPKKFSQNVTIHFFYFYKGEGEVHGKNAEENEVDEVRWFDFEQVNDVEWAFDHKSRIENLILNVG